VVSGRVLWDGMEDFVRGGQVCSQFQALQGARGYVGFGRTTEVR
jgi:hypothetical protein